MEEIKISPEKRIFNWMKEMYPSMRPLPLMKLAKDLHELITCNISSKGK